MKEVWKDLYFKDKGKEYNFIGLYQVSNTGKIKSLKRTVSFGHGYRIIEEKILKPRIDSKNKYLLVNLSKNRINKNFLVHRLVAHMFVDGYFENADINHKDENTLNNNADNLEWCTRKHNINYGNHNKNMVKTRKENGIFKGINHPNLGSLIERWDKQGNLLDMKYQFEYVKMGFLSSSITNCCKGKYKTHKGFIFKYHKDGDNDD